MFATSFKIDQPVKPANIASLKQSKLRTIVIDAGHGGKDFDVPAAGWPLRLYIPLRL